MADKRKTILIVDDDEGMRETLTAMLRRDYRVLQAATGEFALQVIEKEDIDLMLLDVRLPGISGFEVLKIVRENYPYIEVIVISVLKELDVAIEAMRSGAYHYISKDLDLEGVRTLVGNASERQDLNRDVLRLSAEVAETHDREFIAGGSRSTKEILELVHKVAKLSATVLILVDAMELAWQRAKCRGQNHAFLSADPVLVGLNTLQHWLWQRLQAASTQVAA